MKRLLILAACVLLAVPVYAGTVEATLTTTAAQDARLDSFLTSVNADRVSAGQAAFADINAYADWLLRQALLSAVRSQEKADAQSLVDAAPSNYHDTAPNGQCTGVGLAVGCKKGEVACVVLTGAADCGE